MDHFGQLTMKQTIAKWNVCPKFEACPKWRPLQLAYWIKSFNQKLKLEHL